MLPVLQVGSGRLCDEAGTGSWEMGAAGRRGRWGVTGQKDRQTVEGEELALVCAHMAGAASSDGK